MLPTMPPPPLSDATHNTSLSLQAIVYIVDDDRSSRELLDAHVRSAGYKTEVFSSAVDFLDRFIDEPTAPRCLISDVCMPSVDGLALQQCLASRGIRLPMIFVSAVAEVPDAVTAIKFGAMDFLTKPVERGRVIACVESALSKEEGAIAQHLHQAAIQARLAKLTQREREVMELLVKARSTKEIASDLKINAKTVFVHRARVLEKMGVDSLVELSHLMSPSAT